jgi:hypothetical protein
MTSFVQPQFSSQHVGANRAVRTVEHVSGLVQGARGGASLLLAAVVSAVLVVANQVVDTWSEGHLLTAWAVLWAIAFAALALLAGPLRRAATTLRATVVAWNERQIAAEQDRQMMRVAMTDARVMADISRAMSMGAARDVRNYF